MYGFCEQSDFRAQTLVANISELLCVLTCLGLHFFKPLRHITVQVGQTAFVVTNVEFFFTFIRYAFCKLQSKIILKRINLQREPKNCRNIIKGYVFRN